MSYDNLNFHLDNGTAIVTLSRPEKRNALSRQLMRELIGCLDAIERNDAVRAVILAAEGKVFSSGHDLTEVVCQQVSYHQETFGLCTQLMLRIQSIPQPVIAEVQGVATAAGCQLVASCDLAVASVHAGFATPGVRIGLFCSTPMVALTRAIGRKRSLQMLLTGEQISAQIAAEWGLINFVVEPEQLRSTTLALAARIAEASPLTVRIGKQAFYSQIDLDQNLAYSYAKEVMTSNAMAYDAQEGITAFLKKRQPVWRGE